MNIKKTKKNGRNTLQPCHKGWRCIIYPPKDTLQGPCWQHLCIERHKPYNQQIQPESGRVLGKSVYVLLRVSGFFLCGLSFAFWRWLLVSPQRCLTFMNRGFAFSLVNDYMCGFSLKDPKVAYSTEVRKEADAELTSHVRRVGSLGPLCIAAKTLRSDGMRGEKVFLSLTSGRERSESCPQTWQKKSCLLSDSAFTNSPVVHTQ